MIMIQMGKPPRQDAVAEELRALEDKRKEESPTKNSKVQPYVVVLIFLTVLALALVLM